MKLPAKKVKEADFYDKFKPDDSDFELSESDLEELREFGYHSEDEMEDYFAQEAIDMFDDNKLAQLEGQVRHKFLMHKEMNQLLSRDLEKVPDRVKQIAGVNTFAFGDNRNGKCGVGQPDQMFVTQPSRLYNKFQTIACGYHHSLIIDDNNLLYSFGRNNFG